MSKLTDTEIVTGAYCAVGDLRVGDVRLPAYMGDGSNYVKGAADEIDAALGHLYVTPINLLVNGQLPLKSRPAQLTLKKINWQLATGRMVLEMSQSAESQTLHAYGMSLLNEALGTLKQIVDGDMQLTGATRIEPDTAEAGAEDFTGPRIFNEDPESLVKSFYERRGIFQPQASPYGIPRPIYRGVG